MPDFSVQDLVADFVESPTADVGEQAVLPTGPLALETLATGTHSCKLLIGLQTAKLKYDTVEIKAPTGYLVSLLEGQTAMVPILRTVLEHCVTKLGPLSNPPAEMLRSLTLADAHLIALLIMAVETDDKFKHVERCPHCKGWNQLDIQATSVRLVHQDRPFTFEKRDGSLRPCVTQEIVLAGQKHTVVIEIPSVQRVCDVLDADRLAKENNNTKFSFMETMAERQLVSFDGDTKFDFRQLPYRASMELRNQILAVEHPMVRLFATHNCNHCKADFGFPFPVLGWTDPFVGI